MILRHQNSILNSYPSSDLSCIYSTIRYNVQAISTTCNSENAQNHQTSSRKPHNRDRSDNVTKATSSASSTITFCFHLPRYHSTGIDNRLRAQIKKWLANYLHARWIINPPSLSPWTNMATHILPQIHPLNRDREKNKKLGIKIAKGKASLNRLPSPPQSKFYQRVCLVRCTGMAQRLARRLATLADTSGKMSHVGQGLQRGIVRALAANSKQKLLHLRLDQRHDLRDGLDNLIFLQETEC